MANDITDFFKDMGHDLFGKNGLTSDVGVGWRDVMGKDGLMRNWWSGDMGGGSHTNANLRNWAKFVGTQELGSGIDDSTGGNWGGSAVKALGNVFSKGTQQSGSNSGTGMTGVRGQAPSNIFEAAPGLMGTDPNLYNANADDLKSKGRHGDDQLLHVSSDELNQLRNTGKVTQNPNTGLPEAFSFGDILGPIGNAIGRNTNNQDLTGIANTASNASNPLAAPQRQQFQQQLGGMMTPQGAQDFMQNDPSIQAQKRMIGDQMSSTFAKSGNMPLTGIMGSAQLANAFGGQYNQRIQDLTTLGGYNQGNPYGGMPYTAMMQPTTQGNASMFGAIGSGLGGLFGGGSGGGLGGLFGGSGGGGDISSLFNNPQYMGGGGMGFD